MNLDDVIPNPHYRMCHSRIVGAPPTVVWMSCIEFPCRRSPWGVR